MERVKDSPAVIRARVRTRAILVLVLGLVPASAGGAPPASHHAMSRRPASSSPRGPSSRRSSSRKARASPTTGPGPDAQPLHDLIAGQVGPDGGSAPPARRSSAMRASSSSIRRARARALMALRVVQSQRVSSLSRSRVVPARARSGARPCRSTPCDRCGTAGAGRRDARPSRCRRSSSAAPPCASGSCGRPPPRGGGTSLPLGRTTASWACRRRGRGRPAGAGGPATCSRPRRSCGPARPCGGGWGPARAPGRAVRAGSPRPARCAPGTTAPPPACRRP